MTRIVSSKVSVAAVLLWALSLALFAPFARAEERAVSLDVGERAPTFALPDQAGRPLELNDFDGKITVLEWTNPRCPFVQRHYKAGTMKALAEKYRGKGVRWFAVNSTYNQDSMENQSWAKEHALPYPMLSDVDGNVGKLYGAKTTPTLVIIDRDGRLAYHGAIDDDPDGEKESGVVNYVDKALSELTSGKKVSVPTTKSYGCSVKYKQ